MLLELRVLATRPRAQPTRRGRSSTRASRRSRSRSGSGRSTTTSRRCTRSATRSATSVDMLVDANQCYTPPPRAPQVGRELEKLNVPLLRGAAADRRRRRHALPRGQARRPDRDRREHVHALGLPALPAEEGAIHVLQADASRCGGISEAKRIADLAGALPPARDPAHLLRRADDRRRNLHVVAASSNAPIIEYDRDLQRDPGEARHQSARTSTTASIELPTAARALASTSTGTSSPTIPYSGEIGIGAGSRPAFGLATEVIPDRTSTSLA